MVRSSVSSFFHGSARSAGKAKAQDTAVGCPRWDGHPWDGQKWTESAMIFCQQLPPTNRHSLFSGWWFGTCFMFPYIGNVIIPIDVHIFSEGVQTTNQIGTRCFLLLVKPMFLTDQPAYRIKHFLVLVSKIGREDDNTMVCWWGLKFWTLNINISTFEHV